MICYLCEKEFLDGEDVNDDHVPQSGFFLTRNPPGVSKLKTHKECNSEFQFDEEYVISLIRATSTWNPTGERIWKTRGLKSFTQPGKKRFLERIVRETRPAREILNNVPKLMKNFPTTKVDLSRLVRVLEKIVRGLYFSEFNKTLESDRFEIDHNEFLAKQGSWNITGTGFVSVGNPGKEEFKYLRRFISDNLEYNLFFYNVHYFRLLYARRVIT